jgi:hypothetical protein
MPLDGTTWENTQTREILRTVRDRIARPGAWCQRSSGRHDGSHCIIGWLWVVAGYARGQQIMTTVLLPLVTAAGWPGVADLNDARRTTHADVVALLDRAIASLGPAPAVVADPGAAQNPSRSS